MARIFPARALRDFIKHESFGGVLLILCAMAALIVANSPLHHWYENLLHHTTGIVGVGSFMIEKHVIHWINDGLMAIFFFLIGLEVKREMTEGLLSTWSQRVLPGAAAVGGMALPALVYLVIISGSPDFSTLSRGWAIPAATDIAFAVGIFALLGKRLPISLKVFLLALAIFDDVGAVIIIALFYTADLGIVELLGALGCFAVLMTMNRLHVSRTSWYILIGIIMWAFVLKSGVHATLAGILLALTIPMHTKEGHGNMVVRLEQDIHPIVAYIVLPIFAFANAGVYLWDVTVGMLMAPLTLAIALGLFIGKQIGILSFVWLVLKLKLARMPLGASWMQIWGVTMLAGIGFTMSLFIGSLAFPAEMAEYRVETKLGILIGSFISAVTGIVLLWLSSTKPASPQRHPEAAQKPGVTL